MRSFFFFSLSGRKAARYASVTCVRIELFRFIFPEMFFLGSFLTSAKKTRFLLLKRDPRHFEMLECHVEKTHVFAMLGTLTSLFMEVFESTVFVEAMIADKGHDS